MPIRNCNQRPERTTEENAGAGGGTDFMGLQGWRQKEEVSLGAVRLRVSESPRSTPWSSCPLILPVCREALKLCHFSPILAQALTSSLGPGSLHSAPEAASYNSGPVLSCLKAFDGKRGST